MMLARLALVVVWAIGSSGCTGVEPWVKPYERDRSIVQMRIQGSTFLEIAQQLGIHERTARKVISRLAQSRLR